MEKFKKLLMECIDLSSYEIDISNLTQAEILEHTRKIFESEMIYQGIHPSWIRVKDWLQGLASACTIPFYNGDVVKWLESALNREIKEKESHKLIDRYWDNAAKTLYSMLYQIKG